MGDHVTVRSDEDGTVTRTLDAPDGGWISTQLFHDGPGRPQPAIIKVYGADGKVTQALLLAAVWSIDHHLDREAVRG